MELRYYQKDMVSALTNFFRSHKTQPDKTPLISASTGSGKTLAIAGFVELCLKWKKRVLVLAHTKELVEQNAEKFYMFTNNKNFGIYSAGLNRRDIDTDVIFAGVQSLWSSDTAPKIKEFKPFDVVIVDEAHLIPERAGRYNKLLNHCRALNNNLRVCGLTATPYRLDSGCMIANDGIFSDLIYETDIEQLIEDGYLCNLRTKRGRTVADISNVKKRGKQYDEKSLGEAMTGDELQVIKAVDEIIEESKNRKAVIIFATNIKHGGQILSALKNAGVAGVRFVHGATPNKQRDELITQFKNGDFKFIINVGVLTTGFDATQIDVVVLLRPTLSTGLYVQMVGRGLRIDPRKKDCLILDYGTNVERHGTLNRPRINKGINATADVEGLDEDEDENVNAKACENCGEYSHARNLFCEICGVEFPIIENKIEHEEKATELNILGTAQELPTHKVLRVHYETHLSFKGRTVRIKYETENGNFCKYVCPEYQGGALFQAKAFFRKSLKLELQQEMQYKFPTNCDAFIQVAQTCFAQPLEIQTEKKGKYNNVKKVFYS